MTTPTFPTDIKDFGTDAINGEYILASHLNDLRAEITAIEQSLGANLANTLSGTAFPSKGAILAGSAPSTFTSLAVGTNGQVLSADAGAVTGLVWVTPVDPYAPRVTSLASSATPSPSIGNTDQVNITALATDATFAAPTGSPVDGQKLILRVKDNGTSRSLTWNGVYRAIGSALPSATSPGKTLYIGLIYNAADSRWDCVAQAQET